VPREHAHLATQVDLLGFSLFLRPAVYRKPLGLRWWHWSPPGREAGSGAVGHVALRSPLLQGGRIRSCRTCGALEPPLQGGGVRSHGTRGGVGALPIREVGSEATGHVAAPEPASVGRHGPALQGTWRRVGTHPTPCLYLKLVCRGSRSAGYR
jgi:hypothetical protein